MKIERRTHVVITELGDVIRRVEADPSDTVRIGFKAPNGLMYLSDYLEPDDVDALIAALEEVRSAREVKEPRFMKDKEGSIWMPLDNGMWGIQGLHQAHDCGPSCGWNLESIEEEYGPLTPVDIP